MKVILKKNYEKGNKRLLKGVPITVTPWFYAELLNGGYLEEPAKVVIEEEKKIGVKQIKTR